MFKNKIVIILSLFLISCGTDTGNPGIIASEDNAAQDRIQETHSYAVILNVCATLTSCNPDLNVDFCMRGVVEEPAVVEAIGLSVKEFKSLIDVQEAEISKELVVNKESAKACLQGLRDLTCEDETVLNAVDLNSTEPFKNVDLMVPKTCLDSFIF